MYWPLVVLGVVVNVQIDVAARCPDEPSIVERLRVLLTPPGRTPPDHATVIAHAEELVIELRDAHGVLLGARTLARHGSCDDTAEAVASTLAAWESEIPQLALTPARVPQPVATVTRASRDGAVAWELAVSLLGSVAGSAVAVGGSAEVSLGRRGAPLYARIGFAGMDSRDLVLGRGLASWTRAALMIGPVFNLLARPRTVQLDLHADLAAGWLFTQGKKYLINRSDDGFDPALGGGIRCAWQRWAIKPWLDVTFFGWLRHQNATAVDGQVVVATEVPRYDLWIRAGIAYRSW